MAGWVCVSNADSGSVSVLRVDAQGVLHPHAELSLGGVLMPMAQGLLAAGRRRLYVARRSEPLAVEALALDLASGALVRLGEAPLPASMAYLSTDRSGRYLLAASYQGDLVSVSPVLAGGCVGPVQQVCPTGPQAHAIVAAPSNRHVLATSLGGGQVLQFDFDPETGRLTPNAVPAWQAREGAGPRHLRFHPDGRYVYLLNELDASLDVLAFDAALGQLAWRQTLSLLPPGFDGKPWAADLHVTPDGRYLYGSERTSSTVACVRLDAGGEHAQLIGHTPVEAQPRGMALDATGQSLLVVGQQSHHLSRFHIEADTGALHLLQRVAVGRNPNWIEVFA